VKTFASILAFLVIFIPVAGIGVLFAIDLWEGGIKWPSNPVAAIVVGVVSISFGVLCGYYVARATSRRYDRGNDSHPVA